MEFEHLTGTAVSALAPRREVRVEGRTWRAETVGENIKEGEEIEVLSRMGLILRVKLKQAQK